MGSQVKRYSYRAYPTSEQVDLFTRTFGSTRVVYNKYIENNLTTNKLISYNEACKNLTQLKKQPEFEWLNEVSSIALQQTLKDANRGVQNFFLNLKKKSKRKVNPPKFKKRSHRQSFRIVERTSFKYMSLNAKWGAVRLPKLTQPLKFRMERELPNEPSSVTVIKEANGDYYVSFVVETQTQSLPEVAKHAGIDLGLTHFAIVASSDDTHYKMSNPRYFKTAQAKLKKAQQKYSKTQKGSKNKEKARLKVARLHQTILNKRKDFHYKLALDLVRENQTISIENLAISNMVKNKKLAKSISDAGWKGFIRILEEKAAEHGRTINTVDRYLPSSHTCSKCGVIRETKLMLSEREWSCICGVTHDRDVNAAQVILTVGRTGLACGEKISLGTSQAILVEAGTITFTPALELV
jgi:putative transposase